MTTNTKGSWPFAPGEAPEPTKEELEAQRLAEHQKLIDVLKFTPCTYSLQMWGYGGEYVMGTVSREIYDYFKHRRLSVSDFAWNSDYAEEHEIPEDMWPFPPGSWYECDDMGHVNGVDRNAGTLQICDENSNVVYESSLEDIDGYSDGSPEIGGGDEVWIDSKQPAWLHMTAKTLITMAVAPAVRVQTLVFMLPDHKKMANGKCIKTWTVSSMR